MQRIGVEPDAHALTADGRLALLAGKELWLVTIDVSTEDVTTTELERVDLSTERSRLTLTESHGVVGFDRPVISYSWRLWLQTGEDLVFEAAGEPHHYGQKSDNPADRGQFIVTGSIATRRRLLDWLREPQPNRGGRVGVGAAPSQRTAPRLAQWNEQRISWNPAFCAV